MCIWDRLVSLQNSVHNGPTLVQKFVPRSRIGIFYNERTRSNTLDPKLTFWCVSYNFGAFGLFGCLTKLGAKRAETSAKVRATKSRRKFSQGTHLIHPLDSKMTFWCVSYYLCAFVTVWLPYETRCKTGRCSAKVCATKLCLKFSQRTHPIHTIAP